ncbi:MAG: ribonuclease P protein component 4 [Candidatus Methanomethylicaceae archaeon]|nr:ribonuclease P [Candidatus Verstraetearchaeota archaeon]
MHKNKIMKDIAIQRIEGLFKLAIENVKSNPSLSDRYVEMALEISKRTRVRIPKKWKYFICKSCHSFLYPGIRSRVRIVPRRSPHVVITCLICGEIKRYLIKKRKK